MKKILLALMLVLLQLPVFADRQHLSADSLVVLGTYYYKAERYIDALDVLAQAMDKADQTGNDVAYIHSLISIGNIYTIFDDYDQALHYYSSSLERCEAIKADSIITRIRSNMLICYSMLGKKKEAEQCYRAIGTVDMGNDNLNRFYSYLNQALLMKARNYPKGALYFHTQAMNYAMAHGMNGLYVAAEMGQIATMYQNMGDMKSAEEWYLKCKDYAEKGHFLGPLTTACERLAAIYHSQGNDALYEKYNKLYVEYADTFFRPKEFNSKQSLVSRYEAKLKDRQMDRLKSKNTFLILVIATIATLMLVLVILLVYIYKVNRRLNATQRLLIKKHQEHSHQLEVQSEIFTSIEKASESKKTSIAKASDDMPTRIEEASDCMADSNQNTAESESGMPDDAGLNQTDSENPSPEEELLTKTQADMLLMAIAQVMEKGDTICDPDFSLAMLAQFVGSNTKYVSWVINKNYGKNFKTYLNEYRIRIASQMLMDTGKFGNLTIASIAERVGYKSPASFHQAFKKIYGMTPAAYVKLAKQKEE